MLNQCIEKQQFNVTDLQLDDDSPHLLAVCRAANNNSATDDKTLMPGPVSRRLGRRTHSASATSSGWSTGFRL